MADLNDIRYINNGEAFNQSVLNRPIQDLVAFIDSEINATLNQLGSMANENANDYVLKTTQISTGSGLNGGGNLSSNRTLSVDNTVLRTTGDQTKTGTMTLQNSSYANALVVRHSGSGGSAIRHSNSAGQLGIVGYQSTGEYVMRFGAGDSPTIRYTFNTNGHLEATQFVGSGAGLTSIPAGNLTGSILDARLPKSNNWDAAYTRSVTAVSGSGNGTLTLTRQGANLTANLSHTHNASEVNGLSKVATSNSYADLDNLPTINGGNWDDAFSRSVTAVAGSGNGTLTLTRAAGNLTTDLSHTHGYADLPISAGDVANWNTAFAERGSQIAGTGLTWSSGNLNIQNPFNPSGNYASLRARGTTKADVGLSGIPNTNGSTANYLRGDGTWVTPPNTTYSAGDGLSLSGTTFAVDSTVVRTSGNQSIGGFKTITNTGFEQIRINRADTASNVVIGYSNSDSTVVYAGFDVNSQIFGIVNSSTNISTSNIKLHMNGRLDASNFYGNGANITSLNASNLSSGTVPTARLPASALIGDTTYSAGTGLSLSGTTFSVNYGTSATTAAAGNDSRLSNSREWTASTVSQAEAQAGTATTRRAWTSQRVRQNVASYTEPFTAAEKTKLSGIAAGAQANVPTNLGSSGTGATRTITSSTGSNTSITYSADDVGAVPTGRTISISTGTGLTGGATQNLGANRTFSIAVDGSVIRTTGDQSKTGKMTFNGTNNGVMAIRRSDTSTGSLAGIEYSNTGGVLGYAGFHGSTGAFRIASSSVNYVFDVDPANGRCRMYGNLQVDGNINRTSDAKFKNVTGLVEVTQEQLDSLELVAFEWTTEKRKGEKDTGVIAQQVQKVFPTCVSEQVETDEDGKIIDTYLIVDYSKLAVHIALAQRKLDRERANG